MSVIPREPIKLGVDPNKAILGIMGLPGVGKTTLACSGVPGTLLLAVEQRYGTIPGVIPVDIFKYQDLKDVLEELPGRKDITRVVIDTAGKLQKVFEDYVCETMKLESIGDDIQGRGWSLMNALIDRWFMGLKQTGRQIVLLCHTQIVKRKVSNGSIERQEPEVPKHIRIWMQQECTAILYLETLINPSTQETERYIISGGREDLATKGAWLPTAKLPPKFKIPSPTQGQVIPPGWPYVHKYLTMGLVPAAVSPPKVAAGPSVQKAPSPVQKAPSKIDGKS
ncbi:MAG: hypothetical protein UY48_C0003G0077 [Candidatus Gottesmanbacteria bacterium GW2011_GWB1_49_7]|uniref:Uncharacterized protein n=1 Tax=Candidatus Gottesmanbacteria bacterium GW2011_GWB1_49_7 TaxID=1618448 RepID=A0A0G1W3W0_9BACT|nr:MAG: hypothetical protein UY48_C0003G0077 [Candidatus Gottesmanbacteria bacterium GW2011_GWB1_49_7]